MRLFIYKCIVVFIGIYLTYNFTIGKKIDQYEDNMKYLITDQGREKIREIIRKEIKNSIDNKNIIKIEDRMIIRTFIDKIREELDY
tara:strand:- start:767 stop:1024 length:258 start_codon:yes stop_codon:yes gene_type:complete